MMGTSKYPGEQTRVIWGYEKLAIEARRGGKKKKDMRGDLVDLDLVVLHPEVHHGCGRARGFVQRELRLLREGNGVPLKKPRRDGTVRILRASRTPLAVEALDLPGRQGMDDAAAHGKDPGRATVKCEFETCDQRARCVACGALQHGML
jgi:hypothetical protein